MLVTLWYRMDALAVTGLTRIARRWGSLAAGRDGWTDVALWIGLVCGGAAVGAGAVAGGGGGLLLLLALLGVALGAVAIGLYLRDPIGALLFLWGFVVLNAPLASLAGVDSWLGGVVQQSDEALVLLFAVLTVRRAVRTGTRVPWWCVIPPIGVGALGLLGVWGHAVPWDVGIVGLWLGLKLWIMIVITVLLPWKPGDLERIYRVVTTVGVAIAALGLIDLLTQHTLLPALHLTGTFLDERDAGSVYSIFAHPYEFSLFASILFALTFSRFAVRGGSKDLALAVAFAIAVLLSFRLKGFLSLSLVVLIVVAAQVFAREWTQKRRALAVMAAGSCLIVGVYGLEAGVIQGQVSEYTSTATTARARLYETSTRIATDDFPVGAGFGRFASYPSRTHYSPVYDEYGLSSVYGLSPLYPEFVNDVSWPAVLGETGYLGLGFYVVGIALVAAALIRRLRGAGAETRWEPLAALCVLGVILMDSTGGPTLFDWVPAISFAAVLGPALVGARTGRSG